MSVPGSGRVNRPPHINTNVEPAAGNKGRFPVKTPTTGDSSSQSGRGANVAAENAAPAMSGERFEEIQGARRRTGYTAPRSLASSNSHTNLARTATGDSLMVPPNRNLVRMSSFSSFADEASSQAESSTAASDAPLVRRRGDITPSDLEEGFGGIELQEWWPTEHVDAEVSDSVCRAVVGLNQLRQHYQSVQLEEGYTDTEKRMLAEYNKEAFLLEGYVIKHCLGDAQAKNKKATYESVQTVIDKILTENNIDSEYVRPFPEFEGKGIAGESERVIAVYENIIRTIESMKEELEKAEDKKNELTQNYLNEEDAFEENNQSLKNEDPVKFRLRRGAISHRWGLAISNHENRVITPLKGQVEQLNLSLQLARNTATQLVKQHPRNPDTRWLRERLEEISVVDSSELLIKQNLHPDWKSHIKAVGAELPGNLLLAALSFGGAIVTENRMKASPHLDPKIPSHEFAIKATSAVIFSMLFNAMRVKGIPLVQAGMESISFGNFKPLRPLFTRTAAPGPWLTKMDESGNTVFKSRPELASERDDVRKLRADIVQKENFHNIKGLAGMIYALGAAGVVSIVKNILLYTKVVEPGLAVDLASVLAAATLENTVRTISKRAQTFEIEGKKVPAYVSNDDLYQELEKSLKDEVKELKNIDHFRQVLKDALAMGMFSELNDKTTLSAVNKIMNGDDKTVQELATSVAELAAAGVVQGLVPLWGVLSTQVVAPVEEISTGDFAGTQTAWKGVVNPANQHLHHAVPTHSEAMVAEDQAANPGLRQLDKAKVFAESAIALVPNVLAEGAVAGGEKMTQVAVSAAPVVAGQFKRIVDVSQQALETLGVIAPRRQ